MVAVAVPAVLDSVDAADLVGLVDGADFVGDGLALVAEPVAAVVLVPLVLEPVDDVAPVPVVEAELPPVAEADVAPAVVAVGVVLTTGCSMFTLQPVRIPAKASAAI